MHYKSILHYAAATQTDDDIFAIKKGLPYLMDEKDYFDNTPHDIAVLRKDKDAVSALKISI